MDKEERYITEKGIEYLFQLQEKEKFKLDVKRNTLQNFLFCAVAFWIGLFSTAIAVTPSNKTFGIIFYCMAYIPFLGWLVYWFYENNERKEIEKDVQRIEEKIKKMYSQLGVNINKLK